MKDKPIIMFFWFILFMILLALACPAAVAKKTWQSLFAGMAMSLLVVVLPLFWFFASSLPVLVPDWQGACPYGWLDCFFEGKLVLTPLVLWATAALYRIEILRADVSKERSWVMAIFLGAMIGTVFFVFGFVCYGSDLWLALIVPFYITVWFWIRAIRLIKATNFGFWTYFLSAVGTIPFWFVSWIWSNSIYQSLPKEDPGGCFVVTAAGRGHRCFVGPFFEVERRGRRRLANRQLITLWQFEELWRQNFPRHHQLFRRGYNRFGPHLAARIRSPWLADFTYVLLKPVELLARTINQYAKDHL